MLESADRIGGGLINIILGALILWVGQTTFRHAGLLATIDQKFQGQRVQFEAIDRRHSSLRTMVDNEMLEINERTRSRFTREDAEKLESRIQLLADRLNSVHLKLIALDSQGSDERDYALLRAEVNSLRYAVSLQHGPEVHGHRPAMNVAHRAPTYLPPVEAAR